MHIPKRKKPANAPSLFFWKTKSKWAVDYDVDDGKGSFRRPRKIFATEAEAKAFLEEQKRETKKQNRLARQEREQKILTPPQLVQAKAAFAIFDQIPHPGKSLVEAVEVYRNYLRLKVDSPYLKDSIGVFLSRKSKAVEQGELSYQSYRTLYQRLKNFLKFFDDKKKVGEVTAQEIIDWLDAKTALPSTRNNYLDDVSTYFRDVSHPDDPNREINVNPVGQVRLHYQRGNAKKSLRTPKDKRKTPHILQVEDAERVVRFAQGYANGEFLGFTVLGMFCGMRPSEVYDFSKLPNPWQCIRLAEKILVLNEVGKIGDRRNVTLQDNAVRWLEYIQNHQLPLCYKFKSKGSDYNRSKFRAMAFLPKEDAETLITLRNRYRSKTGMTPEEKEFCMKQNETLAERQDVLRHTFGTMYYYLSDYNADKTVSQMGNSQRIFVKHYRGLLAHPDDQKRFWAIVPEEREGPQSTPQPS